MEKDINFSSHQANSQTPVSGLTSIAPPNFETFADGQSVENVPTSTSHWFVIRATHGRASKVYEDLLSLHSPHLEVYLPNFHCETFTIDDGIPLKTVTDTPITHSFLFVRTTRNEYHKLVRAEAPYPFIKGLTPYYDHFRTSAVTGRNDYLIVPDHQFHNFRTLLSSNDINILIQQEQMPSYLNGKKVEVTSGPFTGITGTLLRWKGLRRVFIQLDQIGTFATGFIRNCDFRILN